MAGRTDALAGAHRTPVAPPRPRGWGAARRNGGCPTSPYPTGPTSELLPMRLLAPAAVRICSSRLLNVSEAAARAMAWVRPRCSLTLIQQVVHGHDSREFIPLLPCPPCDLPATSIDTSQIWRSDGEPSLRTPTFACPAEADSQGADGSSGDSTRFCDDNAATRLSLAGPNTDSAWSRPSERPAPTGRSNAHAGGEALRRRHAGRSPLAPAVTARK